MGSGKRHLLYSWLVAVGFPFYLQSNGWVLFDWLIACVIKKISYLAVIFFFAQEDSGISLIHQKDDGIRVRLELLDGHCLTFGQVKASNLSF